MATVLSLGRTRMTPISPSCTTASRHAFLICEFCGANFLPSASGDEIINRQVILPGWAACLRDGECAALWEIHHRRSAMDALSARRPYSAETGSGADHL